MSIHARYGRSSWCGSTPAMTNGNKIPVSTTRNNEMPSMPRCQEIPQAGIHSCCDTNWKPALVESNACSTHRLRAPVATLDVSAASFVHSGRSRPKNNTAIAPINGVSTSPVRIGNAKVDEPVDEPVAAATITLMPATHAKQTMQARPLCPAR